MINRQTSFRLTRQRGLLFVFVTSLMSGSALNLTRLVRLCEGTRILSAPWLLFTEITLATTRRSRIVLSSRVSSQSSGTERTRSATEMRYIDGVYARLLIVRTVGIGGWQSDRTGTTREPSNSTYRRTIRTTTASTFGKTSVAPFRCLRCSCIRRESLEHFVDLRLLANIFHSKLVTRTRVGGVAYDVGEKKKINTSTTLKSSMLLNFDKYSCNCESM